MEKKWQVVWAFLTRLHHQEDGQSMVEYGLIIALIAVVVVAALTLLGGHVSTLFGTIANSL